MTSSFGDLHRETVESFLNNVVVIDDNVTFCGADYSDELGDKKTTGKKLIKPGLAGASKVEAKTTNRDAAASPKEVEINSKDIIQGFAEKGMSCVVHHYKGDDEYKKVSKLVEKADVVVFDWELGKGDDGSNQTADKYLQALVEASEHDFRYLVVYTSSAQDAYTAFISSLNECIQHIATTDPLRVITSHQGNTHDECCIDFIPKGDDAELADQVLTGFSSFSKGFVRNSLLAGLSAIRTNTFKLLSLYPKNIDMAALSHYTALQSSVEACPQADILLTEYLASIFSENIRDILVLSDSLTKSSSRPILSSYFKPEEHVDLYLHNGRTYTPSASDVNAKRLMSIDENQKLLDILLDDIDAKNPDIAAEKRQELHDQLIAHLKGGKKYVALSNDNDNFNSLAYNDICLQRDLFQSIANVYPLRFGTVLFLDDIFYLCLQPICSSVRLTGVTKFPFLMLKKVRHNKSAHFVTFYNGGYIYLKAPDKPFQHIQSFEFDPCSTNREVRSIESGQFKSHDVDPAKAHTFQWVCELKPKVTQVIAHKIATESTRIGMDQFEWLRFKGK